MLRISIHSMVAGKPLTAPDAAPAPLVWSTANTSGAAGDAVCTIAAGSLDNQHGARMQHWLQAMPFTSGVRSSARALASGIHLDGGAETLSYTGFDSRTTAPLPRVRSTLHNDDTPLPLLRDARLAPAPEAGDACTNTIDDGMKAKRDHHDSVLDNSALFPPDTSLGELAGVMKEIIALPAVRDAATPEARDIATTCLMQAVRQACSGSTHPAADTARALRCLRRINLAASIRAPQDCKYSANAADMQRAWSIALHLESTPVGFTLLKAMAAQATNEDTRHASAKAHDDIMLHAYLQAVRAKLEEEKKSDGTTLSPDPLSIHQATSAQKTVLDKAIGQIARHLDASHRHALSQPQTHFTYKVGEGEPEWAIGFIRNGIYTDERSAGGKPTRYALIEGRLNKINTWFDRASRSSGNNALASAWRGARKTAKEFFVPTSGKSPLHAYNRLGDGTWFNRTSGVAIDHAEQGVIHDGRAFKEEIIGNLIKGLKAVGGMHGAPLHAMAGGIHPNPSLQTIQHLARLAVLIEIQQRATNPARLLQGEKPDALLLERASEHMYTWLKGGAPNQTDETRQAIRDALTQAGKPLTLDRLRTWASMLPGGPAETRLGGTHSAQTDSPAFANNAPKADALPDWAAFEKAARQLASGRSVATPTPHFGKLDGDAGRFSTMGEVFENVIARQEPGSKFSLSSGGEIGGGLKEVTRALSSMMTFSLVRPRVDASASFKSEAFLEVEASMSGRQIFAGSRRGWKFQGGAGAAVGPGAKLHGIIGLKAGPSADFYASRERPTTRGLRLRMTPSAGEEMFTERAGGDALAAAFRRRVVERGAAAPGDDGKSMLKNLLQECPDLIVSWHEFADRIERKGVTASAGATANLGPVVVGPSVGIGYESKAAKRLTKSLLPKNGYGQARGFTLNSHSEKQSVAQTGSINLVHRLLGAPSARQLLRETIVTSREIGQWGGATTDTLLLENGAILKQSSRTVKHLTADSLISSIGPQLDRWAIATATRDDKERVEADAHRQAAYDRAYHALSAQLEDARKNKSAGTQYTECYVLTERAVRDANLLYSAAALASTAGDTAKEARCRAALDALLASRDAWEPHSLWTQETSADERSRPALKFGAYLGQRDAVARSNMKIVN